MARSAAPPGLGPAFGGLQPLVDPMARNGPVGPLARLSAQKRSHGRPRRRQGLWKPQPSESVLMP
eukprot:410826-Alexandrium_andersonii.AAC.1